ncbi:MAG TPA: class I SAM-dependent methyltransferase [Steroidobacteraceae bacterium]|jgi:malonyl-CoA O-methyltransferase
MSVSAAALANLDAYDRWAGTYPPAPHNPLMRAEQRAMLEQWPGVAGTRALDLASGTGRYGSVLALTGAAQIISLDYSPEMLRRSSAPCRVRGDMMHLPFASGTFDVIVSGLAVGHAPELTRWMSEASRVLSPGGTLLYSDFHPDAAAIGMTRSFVDQHQRRHCLAHVPYKLRDHRRAATVAHLDIEAVREVRIGIELQESFPRSQGFYRQWHGLPIVLVLRVRKPHTC